MYKEALAIIQPNFSLDEPLKSQWVLRNGERNTFPTDQISIRTKTTALSTFSGRNADLKIRFKTDF